MSEKYINFLPGERFEKERPHLRKKVIFLVLIIILFFAFTACSFASKHKSSYSNDPLEYDPVTLEPKEPEGIFKKLGYFLFKRDNNNLAGFSKDRINVLLLGMGGPGHDGPYLTDTIIIASIKPSTKEIALISIPRDLGVDIPGYGWHKINHANAYGEMDKDNWGAAFATEVISKTFEVDIPYYIRVDFQAFEEIIKEVGGLKINVERSFTDYQYPAPNDLYQTVKFQSGEQIMKADDALKYARSRHGNNGEGSDFARAARQQKILLAVKEKMLSFETLVNPVKIKRMVDSLEKHMTTNMEFSEIITLIKMGKELDTGNITNLVLDSSYDGFLQNSYSPQGSFMLESKTGNFEDINRAIKNIFNPNFVPSQIDDTPNDQPAPDYTDAIIEIQNGTWRAGLAKRVQMRLQDKNYIVETLTNTEVDLKPIEVGGVYKISDNAENDEIIKALQNELRIPIKKLLPDELTPSSSSTDILVILGDDFLE